MPYPRIRHFNSIKVRLEQVYQGSGWMLLHPFQFHKGAIRTQMHLSHSTLLFHFNSIKVRLEPSKRFLNISIELFQFHKGAIRTMQEFIEDCLTLENFNSIKVRLELVFYCTPFDSMKNFNSIKVRLEHEVCIQGERGE